jgi:exopolysaccharide biosynthesis polyprenyl glycosylphosphotransferase
LFVTAAAVIVGIHLVFPEIGVGSAISSMAPYAAALFFVLILYFDYYRPRVIKDVSRSASIIVKSFCISFFVAAFVSSILHGATLQSFIWLCLFLGALGLCLSASRIAFLRVLNFLSLRGYLDNSVAVLVVGGINERVNARLQTILRTKLDDQFGRTIISAIFCDYGVEARQGIAELQDIEVSPTASLSSWIGDNRPERIIVLLPSGFDMERTSPREPLIQGLNPYPIQIEFVGDDVGPCWRDLDVSLCGQYLTGKLDLRPLSETELICKRAMDLCGALLLMPIVIPIIGIISLLIKIDSPGPVLFRQTRSGVMNKPFEILKFRTMHERGGADGEFRQASRDDPRVTRIGAWLRRTSLDELPQFCNVLGGSMSLVGPRPHAVQHDHIFRLIVDDYGGRLRVKPGITGWAQIHGLRGPTPTKEVMEQRLKLDRFYIENWSLALDFRILLATLVVPFRAEAF